VDGEWIGVGKKKGRVGSGAVLFARDGGSLSRAWESGHQPCRLSLAQGLAKSLLTELSNSRTPTCAHVPHPINPALSQCCVDEHT